MLDTEVIVRHQDQISAPWSPAWSGIMWPEGRRWPKITHMMPRWVRCSMVCSPGLTHFPRWRPHSWLLPRLVVLGGQPTW